MNPLLKLTELGQSVWLDNISRGIIKNDELKNLIQNDGLRGVTSNPTIFQKAIGSGKDYDTQLRQILENDQQLSSRQLFEALAVKDIQDGADLLMNVYKETGGYDGYISIEVSPDYAYDTKATIDEAARLSAKTGRPNVMIKIPATSEGIPAIKEMISRGVNINVTLIFSPEVYEEVVEAYISGLEERSENFEDLSNISSVASFFISRIDTVADKAVETAGRNDLKGKTAIANAKLVYKRAKELFGSERFKKLQAKGAKVQRLLWASTSTKNPDYPDTIYVDELIGKDTVNTMPPATIDAFRDHGKAEATIEKDVDKAEAHMNELQNLSINFKEITQKLTKDGVDSFAESFRDLLNTIDKKKVEIISSLANDIRITLPPAINQKYRRRLQMWENENIAERLWEKDFKLWKENKEDDKELSNRLGWLDMPYVMQNTVKTLKDFAEDIRAEFDHIILLGMGGSSLAPEVFYKIFGQKKGFPELKVLDSTHPQAVKRVLTSSAPEKTFFIVSSKSGTTTETSSFMHTALKAVSEKNKVPGNQFAAITDAGTVLETFALNNSFRKIFHTPSEVGGRYSALTFFGLVPAALIGVDIEIILNRAYHLMAETKINNSLSINGAYKLGAALGELAEAGKNKLIFVSSPKINSFPDWAEQLIAESTGKEGKGIVPVIEDGILSPDKYGADSTLVYLRLRNDENQEQDRKVEDLEASGIPVIVINLEDEYDIGREFFRWEIGTALSGTVMKINPFDQPNVQLAKTLASEAIAEFKKNGTLGGEKESFSENGISVFTDISASDIKTTINNFLKGRGEHSYLALLAFLDTNEIIAKELKELSLLLRRRFNTVVTSGFGPRFLHSTGQLHKGDSNEGYFIQFTSENPDDLDVPGEGYSFGTLIKAQSRGDLKALKNLGRKTLRFHFNNNAAEGLRYIVGLMEK
jgi:transaldolase / glucose-6-phosphate isomerase